MGINLFPSAEEWQAIRCPHEMLLALGTRKSPWKWSTRKARLFACACCRRIWHLFTDPADRKAVELAERVADKEIRLADLKPAHEKTQWIKLGHDDEVRGFGNLYHLSHPKWGFAAWIAPEGQVTCRPAHCASFPTPWGNTYQVVDDARALLYFRVGPQTAFDEAVVQCSLLRDIVGDRPKMPAISSHWLSWNNHLLRKLALEIYESREFDRLPILADALEEAGCTDSEILNHCRQPGVHARGCWVVDLLLGKK